MPRARIGASDPGRVAATSLTARLVPETIRRIRSYAGERLIVADRPEGTGDLTIASWGHRSLEEQVEVDARRYRTPVALAVGFDYNGRLTRVLPHVGFGAAEVGSVTARPSEGNPKPRLKRLVRSRSLVVSKGLRTEGVAAIIRRLKPRPREAGLVVGVSIARTNDHEAASLEGGSGTTSPPSAT
jgi:hypothetical protein